MGKYTKEMIKLAQRYEKKVNGIEYTSEHFLGHWEHLIRAYGNGLAEFQVKNNRWSLHNCPREEGVVYRVRFKNRCTIEYKCVNGQWEEVWGSQIDDEIYFM